MESPDNPANSMLFRVSEFIVVKVIGGAIVGACLGLLLFFLWPSFGVFSTAKFDASAWLSDHSTELCFRGGMASDIKYRVLQKGMPREQVMGLLGKPDHVAENEYMYALGICSGWDVDLLHVYFGPDGRLVNSAIRQH